MYWNAKWIRPLSEPEDAAVVFIKEFLTTKDLKSAELEVTALGVYEANLNGHRISDYVLAPGWTTYHKRLQYQTYDITDMIQEHNTMYVTIQHGWIDDMAWSRYNSKQEPKLIALIELCDKDGGVTEITTDGQWQECTCPVLCANIYDGEHYDARITPTPTGVSARCSLNMAKQRLMPQKVENIVEHES